VEDLASKIAQFDLSTNAFQERVIPTPAANPVGLTSTISAQIVVFGTEGTGNKIFAFFPASGVIKEYTLPNAGSFPGISID
jgi:hypothetical protein